MKPTRSAKRTETWRRSAAAGAGAADGAGAVGAHRRAALVAEPRPGSYRVAVRAGERQPRAALGAELRAGAVLGAAGRADHAPTSAAAPARRPARATASRRAARRSRAPLRASSAASPSPSCLAVLEQRDREPERERRARGRARRRLGSRPRRRQLGAEPVGVRLEERRALAGGSASIRSSSSSTFGRVAEREAQPRAPRRALSFTVRNVAPNVGRRSRSCSSRRERLLQPALGARRTCASASRYPGASWTSSETFSSATARRSRRASSSSPRCAWTRRPD